MNSHKIRAALEALKPDETITLRPTTNSQSTSYWFRVHEDIEFAPLNLFMWLNRPELAGFPGPPRFDRKTILPSDVPRPKVEFRGTAEQLRDFYYTTDSFFLSERLFQIVSTLDDEALRSVRVDGESLPCPYYLCTAARALDALDESSTTAILRHVKMEGWSYRTVMFEGDRFAVSQEVPSGVHLFAQYFGGFLVLSRALVDVIAGSGAKGMRFWPTNQPPFSDQTIRI